MLNLDVCKVCLAKENFIGMTDVDRLGVVWCPMKMKDAMEKGMTSAINIKEGQPPVDCPYITEHVVSQ
jgi:hypothetical protein